MILFWIVFFCLGWRIVTDEGQLLYFIREPFENNLNRVNALKELSTKIPKWRTAIYYIGKPFVLCITCMASIWGTIIYTSLADTFSLKYLILHCFSASFIQTVIYKLYAKLD